MSREDEARLADRLIAGDPSAFRELVEAYKRKVYGLAFEMTRNHADAEDISQVAFMKIYRARGTLRPGCGLSTWIYQIVHNSALDLIRKRSSYPVTGTSSFAAASPAFDPADPAGGPEDAAESASLRRRIDTVIAGFSEREREVFILRHYHDLKVREIAQALGISPGAVKSYLFRSLRKLQEELDRGEPGLATGVRR
jgi:RNA polymerase sigma-70 factor (ECF subfamily)